MAILNILNGLRPQEARDIASVVGVGLMIGADIYGASSAASAAKKSGAAARDAATANRILLNQNQNKTNQMLAPYLTIGSGANSLLSDYLGIPGGTVKTAEQLKSTIAPETFENGTRTSLEGKWLGDPNGVQTWSSSPGFTIDMGAYKKAMSDAAAAPQTPPANYGSLLKPFSTSDFKVDPGYEFALSEGQKALQRSQAASGGLISGAAAKGMDAYTQGVADQQYGAAYDRYNTNQNNIYSKLSGQQQVGIGATNTGINTNTATTNGQMGVNNQIANAAIGSIQGQSAAWTTGLNNVAGDLGSMGSAAATGSGNSGWYPTMSNPATSNIAWNPQSNGRNIYGPFQQATSN